MPREFKRADRVADAMLRSVSAVLRSEVRDPRIGMVNVNQVQVSRDCSNAKIFVTFIGVDDEKAVAEAVKALNEAAGFIRSYVARDLDMRVTPKLHFEYDRVAVGGQKLSNLIDKAVAADRAHKQD